MSRRLSMQFGFLMANWTVVQIRQCCPDLVASSGRVPFRALQQLCRTSATADELSAACTRLYADGALAYQAAAFDRAAASGHTPPCLAVLEPDATLPRGALLVRGTRHMSTGAVRTVVALGGNALVRKGDDGSAAQQLSNREVGPHRTQNPGALPLSSQLPQPL